MRVTVTGATGFVGSHLVTALVERGHDVRAFVRPERDLGRSTSAFDVVRGDVRDPGTVRSAVRGSEAVIHLAVAGRGASLREHRAVSVGGVENLLRAAREFGVSRIVVCSTVGVHGRLRRLPADEGAPFRPETAYQVAKAEAERVVRRFVRAEAAPVVVVRPTMIYGPGDLASAKLYRDIVSGTLIAIGRSEQSYHGVYVQDFVHAVMLAMEVPDVTGETFVIADARAVSQVDLFRTIASAGGVPLRRRILPARPFVAGTRAANAALRPLGRQAPFTKAVHFFTHPRSFDISRARERLGYRPRVTLAEGVRRTLAWYRERGLVPS